MPKVSFDISPEKEYEYHQLFCKTPGFNRMSTFSEAALADKSRIIRKINNFWDEEDRKLIQEIESAWRTIEMDYFKMVAELTGVDWLYQTYHAYFLAFGTSRGFSNPFNTKSEEFILSTGAIINPKFLTGHELFHSHYYYIVSKMGLTERLSRTIFIEGVASLMFFETKMGDLFPETNFISGRDSYPEVKEKWPILLEHWEKRVNFEMFLSTVAKDNRL